MSARKMIGFTAASLICLGLAGPASAADCAVRPAPGGEEIMSRVQPTAKGRDARVTEVILAEARSARAASSPAFSAADGEGPEQQLPQFCLPPLICCVTLPILDIYCCLTPIGNFCEE